MILIRFSEEPESYDKKIDKRIVLEIKKVLKRLKKPIKRRKIEWRINTETGKSGMLHVLLSLPACPSSIKYQ